MMLASRFSSIGKSIIGEIFGDQGLTYFWEARFIPRWLPALLGLATALASAIFIINQDWHFLIALTLAIPSAIVFNRYPFASVMLWLLLTPYFVLTPSTAGRSIFWVLHRAMIPAALVIVILADWLNIKKRERVRFGWAEAAVFLFALWTLGNILLLSNEPTRYLIRFYDRLVVPICMYLLVRLISPDEKDFKRLVWIALVTVTVESGIGLLSWFAPSTLPSQWLDLQGARTVGTFGNAAVYTSTLIFLSLLLLQYAADSASRRIRVVFLLVVGLAMFCVAFSFSRDSWLGGVVVLLGLMLVYPKVMLRLTFLVVLVASILSISVLSSQVSWAQERLNDSDTADSRIIGYAASTKMIRAKPLFGWGWGNYDLYADQFKESVGDIISGQHRSTSHNTYLSLMAELGVIALFLYLFPMLWWLVKSIKVSRKMPQHGFWSWRLLAMLWLLMLDHLIVSNFMDMVRFNHFGTTIWWLALGLIASMVHPHVKPNRLKGKAGL